MYTSREDYEFVRRIWRARRKRDAVRAVLIGAALLLAALLAALVVLSC